MTVEVPMVKFIDQEGQVPTITKVQKTVEVPQFECWAGWAWLRP